MENKRKIIERITQIEWEMFVSVNEGEERASCQEDRPSFEAMRFAQFETWPFDAVESYLGDLNAALSCGRNLVEEKYIHMMKSTEPSQYAALLPRIRTPSEEAASLAHEVSDLMLEQTRLLFELYPYIAGHGRPLYSTFDYSGTSVETYQLGELLTYSEKTLMALKRYLTEPDSPGSTLARDILENTIKHYGYESLETAEAATKERIDKMGIQFTFGCCAGDDCEV